MYVEDFYQLVVDNQQDQNTLLLCMGVCVCCIFVYLVFNDMYNKRK